MIKNLHKHQTITNGLIIMLMFSWMSMMCQHCLALTQVDIDQTDYSGGSFDSDSVSMTYEHCLQIKTHAESETDSPGCNGACENGCTSTATIQKDSQTATDHQITKHFLRTTPSYRLVHNKAPSEAPGEPPPDRAIFLPFERYTVQLK